MVETWYAIVALMLTLYVVLDGFDLGAGALHLFVARADDERRAVIAAIGPYWDGNEVWLLASGGALFVAFPGALAAGLSGFYLAIFVVAWLLLARGLAIECRSHLADGLWRTFWDVVFAGSSGLLAVFLGVAFGNVVRGVPLTREGWFALTLFTDFRATPPVGVLDWYTLLSGVFAALALALHGAVYLGAAAEGEAQRRAVVAARWLTPVVLAGFAAVTLATGVVNRPLFAHAAQRPLAWAAIAVAVAGLVVLIGAQRHRHARRAFAGSCAFLAGVLLATAASLYPTILRASGDAALSLTALSTHSDVAGLRAAFAWWCVGFPLAVGYFVVIARVHRRRRAPQGA